MIKQLKANLAPTVFYFTGRFADWEYYNMDLAMGAAMDVDITKTPNHAECIRCGKCIKSCPTKAICYQYGFGDKSKTEIKEN